MEIETPVLLAYAIDDSTDIFRISGGGLNTPNPPLGTPLVVGTCKRGNEPSGSKKCREFLD